MHPTTAYEITKARIAEQRGESGWGSTARAAAERHSISAMRRPQRARTLAGRVLLLLTAPVPTVLRRSRRQTACSPSAPCACCV